MYDYVCIYMYIFHTVNTVGAGWDMFRLSKTNQNGTAMDHWQDYIKGTFAETCLPSKGVHKYLSSSHLQDGSGSPHFGQWIKPMIPSIVPVLQAMSFCYRHITDFKRLVHLSQTKPTKNALISEVWSREHPNWGRATTQQSLWLGRICMVSGWNS